MAYNPDYTPVGLNRPRNPYYRGVNHVKIAKIDSNRTEFFGTVGGVEGPEVLGPEQVVNGTFPADLSGWTLTTGNSATWISPDVCEITREAGQVSTVLSQTLVLNAGEPYRFAYTQRSQTTPGDPSNMRWNGSEINLIADDMAVDTMYSVIHVISTGTADLLLAMLGSSGRVGSVSVRQVIV